MSHRFLSLALGRLRRSSRALRWPLAAGVFAVALHAAERAPLHLLTYSGDQSALVELDAEIQAAGTNAAKLAAIEARLFGALRENGATFAARQAICQRLGTILVHSGAKPETSAYKPLGTMLADERDSDIARLALEPVAGAAIDQLFLEALAKTQGRARIGIVGSIGRRRIAAAVGVLEPLLRASDAQTQAAAAAALASIGTPAAHAALRNAPATAAVIEARIAAAQQLPRAEALGELRVIENDSKLPMHQRAAAFRSSLAVQPAEAVERIVAVLGGAEDAFKNVALEAIAELPAQNLVPALTRGLPTWDTGTQAAAIAALGRRGNPVAAPVVAKAIAHPDPEVRAAAIEATASLPGTRDTVAALAQIAADPTSDDARLARQSLARLDGPGVSAAILEGARRGEPHMRAVYMEQFALRNMTEGLPLLLQSRDDPQPVVRLAAVGALGDLAPFSEQRALIDWAIGAEGSAEQSRALRSVVDLTLRNPNERERGRLFYDAIESVPPETALRLLPALARLGAEASAQSAARLAVRDDPKLAAAAVATLGRWPDTTALPALARIAEESASPDVRHAAVEAALTGFERHRSPWKESFTDVVGRLLRVTDDGAARNSLVSLLGRASDRKAMKIVRSLRSDPVVGERARYTADVVRANQAGAPRVRVVRNENAAKNLFDGDTGTRWNVAIDGDDWIEIGFKTSRPIERITLDQTGRPGDYPEQYEVFVTDGSGTPGQALASGQGQNGKTVIELPPGTRGRVVVIKNTKARTDGQWAISEVYID